MKIAFGIIVFNGNYVLKEVLESIYPYANQILIAEGPVQFWQDEGYSQSIDGTIELIDNFPDPDNKIKVVHGQYAEKDEQCNAYMQHITGDNDYIWNVDSDEVFKPEDIEILFLFNLTDHAVKPWVDAGFSCLAVDIQHTARLGQRDSEYWTTNVNVLKLREEFPGLKPALVISYPPCTDMAVSGAAHFAKKRLANPEFQNEAVELAKVASTFDCPYVIENPVSVLSTLWRKPDYTYHPWQYGGYIELEDAIHPEYPEHIAPRDAYPKKTCLWVGNGFVMPEPKPVEPEVGYSRQHLKLGGKSIKTKNIRSATPRGFSEAQLLANYWTVLDYLEITDVNRDYPQLDLFSLDTYRRMAIELLTRFKERF